MAQRAEPREALRRDLEAVIEGEVRFDAVSRAIYSTDASVYQVVPAGVVTPKSREDVVRTVQLCRRHRVSITARGGGTSQAGQAIGAGVVLDFSRHLDRIVEIDTEALTVTVEPGIVLDELNRVLRREGLVLPLDLSTSSRATLGGMIANNSAGTRSVIYGKTLDYVLQLEVVLADGSRVRMGPLGSCELEAKLASETLEGEVYRTARRLATENTDEIGRRYPKTLRRVGGYNLDELTPDRPFNLARLIVGSEGTLGLVVEAQLRLVALPGRRALRVIHYDDLLDALGSVPALLAHRPSAIELMDRRILASTEGKGLFERLRSFVDGDPAAVLIVELQAENDDSAGALEARLDRLEEDVRQRGLGYSVHRADEAAAQARIWQLRRAALGLSMAERGDTKSISFVEDTAVPPERLRDYVERFQDVLRRHATEAGFYAHASVGLLHIRPMVNLKNREGVERFERIASDIADLVLEFGGALSGEHGDGLVRSPFQRRMFGPELYRAFGELKASFDPTGVLNPGKIVDPPELTESLRFGAGYSTPDPETSFDFSDFDGLGRAVEQCSGVGSCRKLLSGTMCPSYAATREEAHTTRGRANALRLALAGQLGLEGLGDPALYPVLDLCLECKACKTECPTGVDMARIKSEFLHCFQKRHGRAPRQRVLARIDRLAVWGSRLAPLSNLALRSAPARFAADLFLALDRRRLPPPFARVTFLGRWRRSRRGTAPQGDARTVALFIDTFTNHYEPDQAEAAVTLIERAGLRAVVPDRICCGRPLISKGFLEEAAERARATTETLLPLADRGTAIVFLEPSCYSAVRDDHPHLVPTGLRPAAGRVAAACLTFEEWAADALEKGADWALRPLDAAGGRIVLHCHCHQRSLVGTSAAVKVLASVPGAEVVDLDSGCCGMAGSFGYEKEHYAISRAVGEHRLFPALAELDAADRVVAPGFSCRCQIEHFVGIEATSVPELLAEQLGGELRV